MAYLHSFAANGYLFCHVLFLPIALQEWIKKKKRNAKVFQNGHADKFHIADYSTSSGSANASYCRRHGHSAACSAVSVMPCGALMACIGILHLSTKRPTPGLIGLRIMPGKIKKQLLEKCHWASDRLVGNRCVFWPKTHMFGWGFAPCQSALMRYRSKAHVKLSPDAP